MHPVDMHFEYVFELNTLICKCTHSVNDHLACCLELWRLLTDNGVWGVSPRAAQLPHDWVVEAVDGAQLTPVSVVYFIYE